MAKKNVLTRAKKQKALGLMQEGKPAEARPLLQKICQTDRSDGEALFMLGIADGMLGNHSAAEKTFGRILQLSPGHPDANNNLGLSLDAQGRSAEAVRYFRRATELQPDNAGFEFNYANALESLGELEQARIHYEKAIALAPDYPDAYCNLGNVLQEQGDYAGAIAAFEKAISMDEAFVRSYPQVYINLGNALQALNQDDRAIESYRYAVNLRPDYAPAYNSLGNALLQQSEKAQAIEVLRQALVLDPAHTMAYRNLVEAMKYTQRDADVDAMENLYMDAGVAPEAKMDIAFALGKVYADIKDDARSFEYYASGNSLKRESINYNIEKDRNLFAAIKQVFDPEFLRKYVHLGNDDKTPIFILGMPRSGTSLVEQILASHSQVFGAGELNDMQIAINRVCVDHGVNFPEGIATLDMSGLTGIGNMYLERLHAYAPSAQRITDKMPHNFLYLGLIYMLFPRAKIIHCQRNPMDNALSIFRVLFNRGHAYAYELEELGRYYHLYEDLMAHWREQLPGAFYELQYESLVSDQETQIRELLDYCELPWEDACLEFHKSQRAVRTASLVQVRQPIHTRSVEGWRRFEQQLQPFIRGREQEAAFGIAGQ